MPTGSVKWYDSEKGFGFLTRDEGGDVFVHSDALPAGMTALKNGARVEFGIAQGRRGDQALQLRVLDKPPSVAKAVAKANRKNPEDMTVVIEDLIKVLDGLSEALRRGKYPESTKKVAGMLRAVAGELEG